MGPSSVSLTLALLLGMAAWPRAAADLITGQELYDSCDAFAAEQSGSDLSVCRAFMHGFLLGASAAHGTPSPPADSASGETFSERAIRTRVSSARLAQVQAPASSAGCTLASIELADIARAIVKHLDSQPDIAGVDPVDAVREALLRDFPCDT